MQAPPKIKNFICQACRYALPTEQALMKRKIVVGPICERCKHAVEEIACIMVMFRVECGLG